MFCNIIDLIKMLQILDEYIEVSNKKNYFLCKFCKTWKGVIIHVKWGPISKMFLFYICMHTETYSSWILYMFAVLILNSAVCKMCSEAFLKCLCHLCLNHKQLLYQSSYAFAP